MLNKNKEKFALIGHPPDMDLYRAYIKFLKPEKDFRDELLLKLFEWAPSYKIKEFHDISFDGKTFCDGIMIMVPFLPEMRDIRHKKVVEKIDKALYIAAEEGCTIASLGAFTSIILQGQEKDYSKKYNIKITSGNTFTAALIIKSIMDLTEKFDIDLKNQTLAIIGASGDIGSGCATYFGDKVKKMFLTARGIPKLKEVINSLRNNITCDIEISSDNKNAVQNATIVIFVTSAYTHLFTIDDFNPGTIVCDASAPLNVKIDGKLRHDVFLYHGGIASLPFKIDPGFDIGLASSNTLYGCQVEGILIAHDTDLPFSWGRGHISKDKINIYLRKINKNPSLNVSYTVGDRVYSNEELDEYSNQWSNPVHNLLATNKV